MSEDAGTEPEESEAAGPETESGDAESAPDAEADDADGERATEGRSVADDVAEYDDDLAEAVADLEERVEAAETRADEVETRAEEAEERAEELESSLARTRADFQNYKKRAKKRQEQQKERATEDVVSRLTEVRDNLVRALEQDEDADIRPGVESTLETFDRVLAEENVTVVEPDPGEDVDPERHEVMMRVESDQPAGTVADVYKPGYEMAGKVIEAAQVTVSEDDE
ncbi:nucleotide exchange factor GrpE [Halorarum halophilum]|uniref:Protein GrpE n=1 Tax=Halorarum halophilum TaxID=2743090 RepID=A0A7D5KCX5_9EURY|nr:nucleotide exchange factor GrpE [Halobaculum halophilum]QLG26997.1 nucleotide exchange factor GrpE [Halobaculum halophilum]